ncbi:hypothetical protein BDR22DRAFT_838040 [Usnea florida]
MILRMHSASATSFAVQWYGDFATPLGRKVYQSSKSLDSTSVKGIQIRVAMLIRGLIDHSPNNDMKLTLK